ncbi:MAG: cellulase family glycosylhydrolase, partial [Lachnospiraceae bacterium]|nr:cellulase family glycosylhydrolase [Lachnospiraceae bacterium]
MEKIVLQGKRFLTESGKQVIFNGINVLCRGRENNHLPANFESSVAFFKKMGFNLLRFGIFWDAAEPQPGVIDEAYLVEVKKMVRMAEDAGIYIMFDMHQDLFAQKFIDGAPDWACLDDGLPYENKGQLWYEAYLSSEPIIRAADNFWSNTPAADGVGLLDHYEKMWERIGEIFADCDNVIGFEPMNEPFMGSVARLAFGEAMMRMQAKNSKFTLYDPSSTTPEDTAEFMGIVAQKFLEFDRTTLMDFYRRMQKAMQKHSEKPIV